MNAHTHDHAPCKLLLITATNVLDDSVESTSDRELLGALAQLGLSCEAVGRFVVLSEQETDPAPWLAEWGWADSGELAMHTDLPRAPVRVEAGGVPVSLFRGPTTRPHAPDEAERTEFLRLVDAALMCGRPDVVMVRPGPWAGDVLAAARARGLATVVLQSDCTPRDPAPFRDADLVLTPSRFAANYLREAFGLVCASLPPVVPTGPIAEPRETGAVVFDATGPGGGLLLFAQIAEELGARRPNLPLVVIGAAGALPMPRGGSVRCVSRFAAASVWPSARVCLAPLVAWEHAPRAALAALGYGVPAVASDRGCARELLGEAAVLLPLPDRVTPAFATRLRPDEVAP